MSCPTGSSPAQDASLRNAVIGNLACCRVTSQQGYFDTLNANNINVTNPMPVSIVTEDPISGTGTLIDPVTISPASNNEVLIFRNGAWIANGLQISFPVRGDGGSTPFTLSTNSTTGATLNLTSGGNWEFSQQFKFSFQNNGTPTIPNDGTFYDITTNSGLANYWSIDAPALIPNVTTYVSPPTLDYFSPPTGAGMLFNGLFTVPKTGLYLLILNITWLTGTNREIRITSNGTPIVNYSADDGSFHQNINTILHLISGMVIAPQARCSGGPAGSFSSSTGDCSWSAKYMGPVY
jgi:hypothetical protein